MHAERQKQYRLELKEWYDKKNSIENEADLIFTPQINPKSQILAQKRDKTVYDYAKDYSRTQRSDIDTNTVDYLKN